MCTWRRALKKRAHTFLASAARHQDNMAGGNHLQSPKQRAATPSGKDRPASPTGGKDKLKLVAAEADKQRLKMELQSKDKQPFYNVLVSDGSNRYAAQENLEPVAHQAVTHPEVGKYFLSFSPRLGYGANKQSRGAYPDDRQQPCPDTEPAQDQ